MKPDQERLSEQARTEAQRSKDEALLIARSVMESTAWTDPKRRSRCSNEQVEKLARQLTEAEREKLEAIGELTEQARFLEARAARYQLALERTESLSIFQPGERQHFQQVREIARAALDTGDCQQSPPKDSASPSATGSEGET